MTIEPIVIQVLYIIVGCLVLSTIWLAFCVWSHGDEFYYYQRRSSVNGNIIKPIQNYIDNLDKINALIQEADKVFPDYKHSYNIEEEYYYARDTLDISLDKIYTELELQGKIHKIKKKKKPKRRKKC